MATAPANVKVLTVGPAVGSIKDLFAKIKAIDAKHGKFDFVLCTGDFFGPIKEAGNNEEDEITQLLTGQLQAPIECYVMQGEYPLPESVIEKFAKTGGQLAQNVFLLNKSGVLTTAHGLRIACLGGIYDQNIHTSAETAPGFTSPYFSSQTTERLLANTLTKSSSQYKSYSSLAAIASSSTSSQLVDIFISNTWPATITTGSSAPLTILPPPEGGYPVDDVIRKAKPRYHFAAGTDPSKKFFWEREPYVWDDEDERVSRFVSLGAFGGEQGPGKKQRWFYAFSIAPSSSSAGSTTRPPNATANPFTAPRPAKRPREAMDMDAGSDENFIFGNNVRQSGKRSRIETGEPGKPPPGYKCRRCEGTDHFITDCPERTKPPEGYICKICNEPGHLVRDCPTKHAVGDTGGRKPRPGYVCRACGASDAHLVDDCPVANAGQPSGRGSGGGRGRGGRRGPPREIQPDECWFCLSNPNLSKHLIVSIGMESYLSLPKGQIIPTQSAAPAPDGSMIPGGGHVLIIPHTHYPTLGTIPDENYEAVTEEIDKYKTALRALYAKHGKTPIFFELGRNSAKGGHAHVQVVPIPNNLCSQVEEAFIAEGRNLGVDFHKGEDAQGALDSCRDGSGRGLSGGAGSYFRVDLPAGGMLVHLLKGDVPFGVNFGRQVTANLLNIPDRLDWKACMLSEEEDTADAQAFKNAFLPFDPTI